jgi:hypothetical protein
MVDAKWVHTIPRQQGTRQQGSTGSNPVLTTNKKQRL